MLKHYNVLFWITIYRITIVMTFLGKLIIFPYVV